MHELAEKMSNVMSLKECDSIITSWLREKVGEIDIKYGGSFSGLQNILGLSESEEKECKHDWKYAYYEPDPKNPIIPVGTYYRCKKCCSYEQGGYCGKHGAGVCECLKIAKVLQPEIDNLFNPKPVETPKMEEKWCVHMKKIQQGYVGDDLSSFYTKPIPSDWDICPMKGCHAPRPTPLSLEQKLGEKLEYEFKKTFDSDLTDKVLYSGIYPALATLALEFAREHKDAL